MKKHLFRKTVIVMALILAGLGGALSVPPAVADHEWAKGYWNRAALVEYDGIASGNVQDAAYYWQDRGYWYGYYPPLPYSSHGGTECTNVTDQWINVCTVSRSVIEPYCSPNQCDGVMETFIFSNAVISGAYILVASDLSSSDRQKVWRHEFGHAMGLGEVYDDDDCVMYWIGVLGPLGETCDHDTDAMALMY